MSFAKTLKQSDANSCGRFSVPRYYAETIFPKLDYTKPATKWSWPPATLEAWTQLCDVLIQQRTRVLIRSATWLGIGWRYFTGINLCLVGLMGAIMVHRVEGKERRLGVGGGYCGLIREDGNNNKLSNDSKGKFTGEI
ncbi:auxin response factor 18 [Artemisia annua]|uniref:Auxin response factor 18 n=1 Tax=Artemisia annua TaxID=35608 RepID=A0A2U1L043_ARTAN|nr:auxin response factor 18 [Artemisia annua]